MRVKRKLLLFMSVLAFLYGAVHYAGIRQAPR